MTVSPSLFDAPHDSRMIAATDWLTGVLLGNVAISLCIIAVATVGLALMTGRLAIRDGVRVAIGCFVLLGAPAIAAGFLKVADETVSPRSAMGPVVDATAEPSLLPPANYDPYAGASLRRD
jgi:type IV secretion system protein VirB2